jgi:hypothetical protein
VPADHIGESKIALGDSNGRRALEVKDCAYRSAAEGAPVNCLV